MYRPVLVTAPTATPISLDEVKAQLDVSYDDKDDLIEGLLAAAVAYLDGPAGILGRCLVSQTWRQDFDYFCGDMRLPLGPVSSVSSVKYYDVNAVLQTISAANYTVLTDEIGTFVRFKGTYSFPVTQTFLDAAVRLEYVCGYASAAAVPGAIKQAMLMLIRQWFDNPSATNVGNITTPMPFSVEALLAPYRRVLS